jgi:glycosyltransferase involved in cell wall biosynthesis
MDFAQLSHLEIILLASFLIIWLVQLSFLLRRVWPIASFKSNTTTETPFLPKVSVIICAKNEGENLQKFLPSILSQNYPEYQVVVVNDCSEDNTEMILAHLKQKHTRLYYTTIPVDRQFHHGKKLALTIGVKAAIHDYLVLTDADCEIPSANWLHNMVQGFSSPDKEMVLGFGGYQKKKGFLNFLVRYDSFYVALQYFGFALSKNPYMGVGRNLAYRKDLFTKNNGLKSHMHLASGDDDLFVQETATAKNTSIVIDHEAHTISVPPISFRNWRIQKGRHLSTTSRYKKSIKLELILDPLSRELFWALGIVLIIFNTFALAVGAFLLTTLVLKLLLWRKVAQKLHQGRLFWGVLLFDILHPWLLIWAQAGNYFGSNKNKWK